ncbi:MAG: choice-of-anchor D domain-containing protein [Verrucomicrobia bacterium]|nr:choice-of-anchor D domain-containing protein [Verrucomicrobiota bacterium]
MKTFRHFLLGFCAMLLSIPNSSAQTPDDFNPNVNSSVHSLAVQADGKILVGGYFGAVGGVARNHIARLNADGSLDTGFNPDANAPSTGTLPSVDSLAVQADGKILIGGYFTSVGGVARNHIARLNVDGSLDPGFNPNASSTVNSVVLQADGKILMGGGFTTVGGIARNRIARLNADGSLDPGFNPSASTWVYSLALQTDGKILVGGYFTTLGGVTRNRIARLNADGSLDTGCNPNASGSVHSVALQADGKILIGGGFDTVGGVARNCITRLQNNVAAAQTLTVTGTSQIDWTRGGSAPEVGQVTFEIWNGSAWVGEGGGTRVAGGWRMTGLSLPASAWVRARGRSQGGYQNGSSGIIEQIATYGSGSFPDIAVTVDGTVLVSGAAKVDFGTAEFAAPGTVKTFTITNVGDAPLAGLAVSIGGTNLVAFTVVSPGVTTLAPGASTTFTVEFSAVGGVNLVAQLSIASNDWDESPFTIGLRGTGIYSDYAFNPNVNYGGVSSFAVQADGKILMGGLFSTVGGVARNNIARLNADGSLDPGFNPNANDSVGSLAVQADGKILMGGMFTTVGGVARNHIARLNADGSLDPGFNPNANDSVGSLAVQADGKILVGGNFTTVGGVARNRIARLNADGSLDSGFNPDANSTVYTPRVYSLALQADGKILMSGGFTTVGGAGRNRIARLNPDGSLDAGFNPDANSYVDSLALQADGKILVGGDFTTVGGEGRNHIARLNADGSIDTGFNPDASGSATSLVLQADGKILVGGMFTTVGGMARNRIARLNADGSLDTGFNPDASGSVSSIALQADGKILVGGDFTTVGGMARNRIARLSNNIAATQTLTVTGTSQIDWTRGGSAPEVGQVTFETWNGNAWVGESGATRVAGGWRMTDLSLPTSAWVRARGRSQGGYGNGSSGIIEQIATYGSGSFPDIAVTVDGTALVSGAAMLDFGTPVWPARTAMTFTIANAGDAPLTGLAVSVGGATPAVFTVTSPEVTTLAPGASTTFTVEFSAVGSMGLLAQLSIASNDGGESPFTIGLRGTGMQPDIAVNPVPNSSVISLGLQADGKILMGGFFTTVGGVARNFIARLNVGGSLDPGFNPNADNYVISLAMQADGKILMGGMFTTVGGVTRNAIARLNADGSLDAGFNPDVSGYVHCLAVQADGKILMSGGFTTVGGVARNNITRLNANGSLDTGFNTDANSDVVSLALQADGKILMGGEFTTVSGMARNRLVRLNADGSLDTDFNPDAGGRDGPDWGSLHRRGRIDPQPHRPAQCRW